MAKGNNRIKKVTDSKDNRIQVVTGNTDVLTVQLLDSINKQMVMLTEEVRKLQDNG